MLYSIREYHVAPNGHQYGIKYYVGLVWDAAQEFIKNYKGTGHLFLYED